jgi:hypothetical protein
MATVAAAVARGAGARAAATAAVALRGDCGAAARGRPHAGPARPLCTAPGTAADMKRYLWERYQEAKRSTHGEWLGAPDPPAPGGWGPSGSGWAAGSLPEVSGHPGSRAGPAADLQDPAIVTLGPSTRDCGQHRLCPAAPGNAEKCVPRNFRSLSTVGKAVLHFLGIFTQESALKALWSVLGDPRASFGGQSPPPPVRCCY